jgi:acyl-CoA reductase-like NAD-dependent aldehyde dehydrogenase
MSPASASPALWRPAAGGAGLRRKGTKVQLEMGGKNPLVVLDDRQPRYRRHVVPSTGLLLDGAALHRFQPAGGDGGHPRPLRRGNHRAH